MLDDDHLTFSSARTPLAGTTPAPPSCAGDSRRRLPQLGSGRLVGAAVASGLLLSAGVAPALAHDVVHEADPRPVSHVQAPGSPEALIEDAAGQAFGPPTWGATFDDGHIFPPYESVLTEGDGDDATRTLVDPPGKDGRALRMVMPPSRGARRDTPNRMQIHPAGRLSWRDGSDAWYGISMYLADDWDLDQVANNREYFASLLSMRWGDIGHRRSGPGGGISLRRVAGDSRPHFVAGRETTGWSYRDGDGNDQIDIGPVVKNRWIDFVVHIRWSASSSGGLREYWRDGKLMGRSTNQNMGTDSRVIHRMGIYQGVGVDHRRTLYWDNHRIGRSYAEVDPSRE